MGKIKGWRKDNKNVWVNRKPRQGRVRKIRVQKLLSSDGYGVMTFDLNNYNKGTILVSNTKSDATKKAILWMKRYPNG